MTERIIKFPDKASSIWRDLEKYYDKVGYLDEEGKAYAKKIIIETVEKYDGWDFEVSFSFQNLNIKDKESLIRWLEKNMEKKINKQISKFFEHFISQIISLKINCFQ